jgi:hypothetical protein
MRPPPGHPPGPPPGLRHLAHMANRTSTTPKATITMPTVPRAPMACQNWGPPGFPVESPGTRMTTPVRTVTTPRRKCRRVSGAWLPPLIDKEHSALAVSYASCRGVLRRIRSSGWPTRIQRRRSRPPGSVRLRSEGYEFRRARGNPAERSGRLGGLLSRVRRPAVCDSVAERAPAASGRSAELRRPRSCLRWRERGSQSACRQTPAAMSSSGSAMAC